MADSAYFRDRAAFYRQRAVNANDQDASVFFELAEIFDQLAGATHTCGLTVATARISRPHHWQNYSRRSILARFANKWTDPRNVTPSRAADAACQLLSWQGILECLNRFFGNHVPRTEAL